MEVGGNPKNKTDGVTSQRKVSFLEFLQSKRISSLPLEPPYLDTLA